MRRTPDELYDTPANSFVMSFLGPVTRLDGKLVRPHDIDVLVDPGPGTTEATITRLLRVGFEVRAELRAGDSTPWVQLTRGQAEALDLREDLKVWLRPNRFADTLVAS